MPFDPQMAICIKALAEKCIPWVIGCVLGYDAGGYARPFFLKPIEPAVQANG